MLLKVTKSQHIKVFCANTWRDIPHLGPEHSIEIISEVGKLIWFLSYTEEGVGLSALRRSQNGALCAVVRCGTLSVILAMVSTQDPGIYAFDEKKEVVCLTKLPEVVNG